MNRINPKKLLHSKWTSVTPVKKELHFMVTEVEFDEEGAVLSCTLEAVLTKRSRLIEWRELQNEQQWLHGWK
ncbi:MAG: TIGR02450 family Trp-rich protein [Thiolinea sp.]